MFTNIKRLFLAEIPTSYAATYTAPAAAGSQAQITRLKVFNSGNEAASVELRQNSAEGTQLYNFTLQAKDTIEPADEWQLNAGDSIFAKATAEGINLYIAGREFIPE